MNCGDGNPVSDEGREARRPPHRAADEFEDRQGPRPNDPQSVLGHADQMIE
jgi:hypothetical protein